MTAEPAQARRAGSWLGDSIARRTKAAIERVQEKWEPVFRPDARQIKNLERDDDSKKSHATLGGLAQFLLQLLLSLI
jgi:hypothetical protein